MMDVTQPQEQLHADVGVGAAYLMPHISQQVVDISSDASDQLLSARQHLINVDDDAFGNDGFQPYGSPSRVRMLHFRVEYRQKNIPIILQDVSCVGECVFCMVCLCSYMHSPIGLIGIYSIHIM